jgi:hypothetical protein
MVQRGVARKMPASKKNFYIKKLTTFAIDVNRAAQNLRKWQST